MAPVAPMGTAAKLTRAESADSKFSASFAASPVAATMPSTVGAATRTTKR